MIEIGNVNQWLLFKFCISSLGRVVTALSKWTEYPSQLTQRVTEVDGSTNNGTLGRTHARPTQVTTVPRLRTMHHT